jgi:ribosomal protein S18 acetylase RimI-like enzyme
VSERAFAVVSTVDVCDHPGVTVDSGFYLSPATGADVAAWLVLASEVAPEFGTEGPPGDEWKQRLKIHIDRGTAWCAYPAGQVEMVGGMWLSFQQPETVTISWLGVRRRFRRRGIARALVQEALSVAGDRAVRVVSFGEGHPMQDAAFAAVELYQGLGFQQSDERAPDGPDGTPRALFIRGAGVDEV